MARRTTEHKHPSGRKDKQPTFLAPHNPTNLSDEELRMVYLDHERTSRQLYNEFDQGKMFVERDIFGTEPFQVLLRGDQHWGHVSTNSGKVLEVADLLARNENLQEGEPRKLLLLVGDELEGFLAFLSDTVASQTIVSFQGQVETIDRLFFRRVAPYCLGITSDYKGHPLWAYKMQLLPLHSVARQYNIPIISNGGTVRLNIHEHDGTYVDSVQYLVAHDPGGLSRYDPDHGIRSKLLQGRDVNAYHGAVHGHQHKTYVQAEIPSNRVEDSVVFASGGTYKEFNPDGEEVARDRFAAWNWIGQQPPGVSLIIYQRHQERGLTKGKRRRPGQVEPSSFKVYPTITDPEGELITNALTILDCTERQGITNEVRGQIHDQIPPSEVRLNKEDSHTSQEPYDETPRPSEKAKDQDKTETLTDPATQYDTAAYDVYSQLPFLIRFVANTRYPSSSGDRFDRFTREEIIKPVVEDPNSYLMILREMFEGNVPTHPFRRQIVWDTIEKYRKVGENNKVLAIMLDSVLSSEAWKGTLQGGDPPFMPGTLMSTELNAPLIRHLSEIHLKVSPRRYLKNIHHFIATLDGLGHFGSFIKTFHGIGRVYDEDTIGARPTITVGGHVDKSGWQKKFDPSNILTNYPFFMPLGHLSKISGRGKKSAKYGSVGGQGIIIVPDTKERYVFGGVDVTQTHEIYTALTLLKGLEILGITDKILKDTRRR